MTVGPGHGRSQARSQLRASTVDRDHVVEILSAAFAEGRLSKDEYDQRVSHALSARTYADLDSAIADLPAPAAPRTNPLAVASLACGVAEVVTAGLSGIPAIVLGYLARRQIRGSGESGATLALAGLVLGWIAVGLWTLIVIVGIVIFLTVAHAFGA